MRKSTLEGQVLMEALIWSGLIMIFLVTSGGAFRLLYSHYRQVLRSGAGYTASSFYSSLQSSD